MDDDPAQRTKRVAALRARHVPEKAGAAAAARRYWLARRAAASRKEARSRGAVSGRRVGNSRSRATHSEVVSP